MACISKIASAISFDCDNGFVGFTSALIINKSDITSYAVAASNGSVTSVTLAEGATAYKVDTVKKSLTAGYTLKQNENAPNGLTHTATITVFNKTLEGRALVNALTNASVVLMTLAPDGLCRVWGLFYGMTSTAIEHNSHENGGYVTATVATPEKTLGEMHLAVSRSVYDNLYAEAR